MPVRRYVDCHVPVHLDFAFPVESPQSPLRSPLKSEHHIWRYFGLDRQTPDFRQRLLLCGAHVVVCNGHLEPYRFPTSKRQRKCRHFAPSRWQGRGQLFDLLCRGVPRPMNCLSASLASAPQRQVGTGLPARGELGQALRNLSMIEQDGAMSCSLNGEPGTGRQRSRSGGRRLFPLAPTR